MISLRLVPPPRSRAAEPPARGVLKTDGFEGAVYWHMGRDGLIESVWYLTGPLIPTVWASANWCRSAPLRRTEGKRRLACTPPALCVLLSKTNASSIHSSNVSDHTNQILFLSFSSLRWVLPFTPAGTHPGSCSARPQSPLELLFETESYWFRVKLAEMGIKKKLHSIQSDQK